jgi:hypothetical protein
MQNNVTKVIERDRQLRKKKPNYVAFGRTLPVNLRTIKFNEDLFDELYKINCPDDLRSLQYVFDGILHLRYFLIDKTVGKTEIKKLTFRSTRALVQHLKDFPNLPRSKFLTEHKMFDKTVARKNSKKPFWSHFY